MSFAKKVLIVGSASCLLAASGAALASATLNGAGATFPAPFYQSAFQSLAGSGGPKVNYQSVGSGAGVRQFLAGTVDFAATDEPIKPAEAAKVARGVVQFPTVGGTIAVAYNKSDCPSLKLTQKQLVDVVLGEIKTWEQLMAPAPPSPSPIPSPPSRRNGRARWARARASSGPWAWAARAMRAWPASSTTRPAPSAT
jgi:phosphate transport system substrate-binding protein